MMALRQALGLLIPVLFAVCASGQGPAVDVGARRLLGINSCGIHFETSDESFYVVTFAKFVDGRFVGFTPAVCGKLQGGPGSIEILWNKDAKGWGFVVESPFQGVDRTSDAFFEKITGNLVIRGKSFPTWFPARKKFQGLDVLAVISAGDSIQETPDVSFAHGEWVPRKYMLACLYQQVRGPDEMAKLSNSIEAKREMLAQKPENH